jgi:hypothetical protein
MHEIFTLSILYSFKEIVKIKMKERINIFIHVPLFFNIFIESFSGIIIHINKLLLEFIMIKLTIIDKKTSDKFSRLVYSDALFWQNSSLSRVLLWLI